MSESPPLLLAFGYGYTAGALAARLRPAGWHVVGTRRSASQPADDGTETIVFEGDGASEAARAALARASHVLVSIPPDKEGDLVLAALENDIAAAPDLRWIGYLSTTGVYGDRSGGWVDEESDLRPSTARARRRAASERRWLALWRLRGAPVHIFRLAGIYGPGRNALCQLRAGRARRIVKPGQVFSRIHVDDIASVLQASMARPSPGRIYNVCDDLPAPSQEVVAYAARLIGMELPPEVAFDSAELSDMARSFYQDNRRVRNDRIKVELGIQLKFPTYKEGLKALAAPINEANPTVEERNCAETTNI